MWNCLRRRNQSRSFGRRISDCTAQCLLIIIFILNTVISNTRPAIMRNGYIFFSSLIFILGFPRLTFGATIMAASPSAIDVQTAINNASNGDTVTVPAGSATWTTQVNITSKSITLQGAGIDQTTITRNTASDATIALNVSLRSTDFVTISGFTFLTVNNPANGILDVGATSIADGYPPNTFRITNCKFNHSPTNGGSAQGARSIMTGGVYGLIDHCTFLSSNSQGGQMITVNRDNSMSGVNTYHTPQSYGDTNNVCIEDCTFNAFARNDGAFDAYPGQKVVFRHNTVSNTFIGWHGYDSCNRSARLFEVYQNTFTFNNGQVGNNIVWRGGTGVVWGNTFDANWGDANGNGFISFLIYAADHVYVRPQAYAPSALWGSILPGVSPIAALGSAATGLAGVDGNFVRSGAVDQGYPLLDQPGRGSFPAGNPGNWPLKTTGYAAGEYEALDPVYQWNNVVGANRAPLAGVQSAATGNYVKANRDYYDNVAKPGYTPLQYPHPLVQNAPPPPTNLRVLP